MSSANVSCFLCQETFKKEDSVRSTFCGHIFHASCLQNWKCTFLTCPECNCTINTTIKIFLNIKAPESSNCKLKRCQSIEGQLKDTEKIVVKLQNELTKYKSDIANRKVETLTDLRKKETTQLNEKHKTLTTSLTQYKLEVAQLNKQIRDMTLESNQKNETDQLKKKTKEFNELNEKYKVSEASLKKYKHEVAQLNKKISELISANIAKDEHYAKTTLQEDVLADIIYILQENNVEIAPIKHNLDADDVQLFEYAKKLKNHGYKSIFALNKSVFVKQNKNTKPIRIQSKNQVTNIIKRLTKSV